MLPGVDASTKLDPSMSPVPHGFLGTFQGQTYLYYRRANRWHADDSRISKTPNPGRAGKIWRALQRCARECGCGLPSDRADEAGLAGQSTAPGDSLGVDGQASEQQAALSIPPVSMAAVRLALTHWKPRTNYRDEKAYRKARRRRPEALLYVRQFTVQRGQEGHSVDWASFPNPLDPYARQA